MGIVIAALVVGVVLIAYVAVERRINQRSCPECGYRASIDGLEEPCPRCGAMIPEGKKN